MLSDGRPLLEAVARAASTHVKAAAVVVMGNRLTAALTPSGAIGAKRDDIHLLAWRALDLMAYMVRHESHLLHRSVSKPDMCTLQPSAAAHGESQAVSHCPTCCNRQHWMHYAVPPLLRICSVTVHCSWRGRRPLSR